MGLKNESDEHNNIHKVIKESSNRIMKELHNRGKTMKEFNRNITLRVIYESLGLVVSLMDALEFEYMVDWRNTIQKWRMEMRRRRNWLPND
ncbi:hypothetical protein LCGC14_1783220 [marine sediment metagenome]|uniref:Uncharacterized protein n=1 Tax=marine sediment metagenome TaxID=412755 RepID=A0A0F9GUQ3_9ZZZZ